MIPPHVESSLVKKERFYLNKLFVRASHGSNNLWTKSELNRESSNISNMYVFFFKKIDIYF